MKTRARQLKDESSSNCLRHLKAECCARAPRLFKDVSGGDAKVLVWPRLSQRHKGLVALPTATFLSKEEKNRSLYANKQSESRAESWASDCGRTRLQLQRF